VAAPAGFQVFLGIPIILIKETKTKEKTTKTKKKLLHPPQILRAMDLYSPNPSDPVYK
jgi:hypothetical protein